ncbi:MAG: T9SS type A sorting domain-containing protein [Bacteroidota bacterium]
MKKIYIVVFLLTLSQFLKGNTYEVTNTLDNGNGSLRWAINQWINSPDADTISFNIPTGDPGYNTSTGVWTISPDSTLPYIVKTTVIDATTQTLNQGNTNPEGPEIQIDGQSLLDYAFCIISDNSVIKGFVFGGFNYAIVISAYSGVSTNNTIKENYLGINYTGNSAYPNSIGVYMDQGTYGNIISNNIISGNTMAGIVIDKSTSNFVAGNLIGSNASGTIAVPNSDGIMLNEANYNIIGGSSAAERNVLSGNINTGILLNNLCKHNEIKGNYIGTDISGMLILSNYTGVLLQSQSNSNTIGGLTSDERNVISGNTEIGVYIESSDSNKISANYLGPDASGISAIKIGDSLVQGNGIELNVTAKYNITGGYTAGERNVISGNRVYGFIYYGNCSYNPLVGNYIGTTATGNASLPNATGICIDASSNHNLIEKNLLSGNMSYGIFIVTNGTNYNEMKGNLIGTNAAGTDTVPNDIGLIIAGGARYNIIGGLNATDRNIISGNRYDGIEMADQNTDSNRIIGNYIGTDITGTIRLGNSIGIGISTNPKHNNFSYNLISGNKRMGIVLYEHADSNIIHSNKIGTAANGTSDLGNGSAGIAIAYGPKHNFIGTIGFGNIIAFNDSGGVVIADSDSKYNMISGNSMWSNLGMGIELFPPMSNANDAGDADLGPNDLMNYPDISSAEYNSTMSYTIVKGNLDTHNPELCTVELFKAAANFFSHGDGKTYLGSVIPDASGYFCDTITGIINGEVLTATATDELMNTSEFSANFTVTIYVSVNEPETIQETISIYPNPSNGAVSLIFSSNEDQMVQIKIMNCLGQVVEEMHNIYCIKGINKICLNNNNSLPSGLYILNLHSDKTEKTIKFKII